MRRYWIYSLAMIAGSAVALAEIPASPSGDAQGMTIRALSGAASRAPAPAMLGAFGEAMGLETKLLGQHSRSKACVFNSMTCDSTRSGALTVDDCLLDAGFYADFWQFNGTAGSRVTINVSSSQFDTYAVLLDPRPEVVADDNDGGAGTNSRIVHRLDASGTWAIGVANFFRGEIGGYSVSLQCSAVGPNRPAAPSDLTAATLSSVAIELHWRDRSNNEDEFRIEVEEGGDGFVDIGAVPAETTAAVVENLQPDTAYTFRVRARNAGGNSGYSNSANAVTLPLGDAECTPSETVLCLSGNRFKVEVGWRDFNDDTGSGGAVSFSTDDSGIFYFFSPSNWEMMVKVLNGCTPPWNSYWVFAAAVTNVEYTLLVTDTQSGIIRRYFNPLGIAAPAITDTAAFASCP